MKDGYCERESELLPVPYYHIVFTIPHCFNELLTLYAKEVYGALFKASWLTIQSFAKDPKYFGAKAGMTTILHTWGQQLCLHPHLHCIVPDGGVTEQGNWKSNKYKDKYLFPKRAMSVVFRAKFMAELRSRVTVSEEVGKQAFATKWVLYRTSAFRNKFCFNTSFTLLNRRLLTFKLLTICFSRRFNQLRVNGKKLNAVALG